MFTILLSEILDLLSALEEGYKDFRYCYAKDTSKKIRAVFKAKGNSGKHLTTNPPFGYIKDPNDKDKWIIDEEAAGTVRRIFQMFVDGVRMPEIARKLTEEKLKRRNYTIFIAVVPYIN